MPNSEILRVNTSGVDQAISMVKYIPGALAKAQKYALQRGGDTLKTELTRGVTKEYYVKPQDFRNSLILRRNAQNIALTIRGTRHTLAAYKMTPTRRPKGNRRYTLRGAVKRGGGMKVISSKAGGGVFLKPSHGKHPYIPMRRTGRLRQDIAPIISPAYPQLVEWNDDLKESAMNKVEEVMRKEFQRQALRLLGATV